MVYRGNARQPGSLGLLHNVFGAASCYWCWLVFNNQGSWHVKEPLCSLLR